MGAWLIIIKIVKIFSINKVFEVREGWFKRRIYERGVILKMLQKVDLGIILA